MPTSDTAAPSEAERDARHAEKMKKHQKAREKIQATKTVEKGLLIVNTGNGKGKSTSALGLIMRAAGHGMRVAFVQFIKGTADLVTAMEQVKHPFRDGVKAQKGIEF
jgi:cob(I)alamin adenosyltransferase